MDYYAQWPAWKVPKWLGATLGGIFTVIIIGCAWMIVDLTRPHRPHVVAAAPAAAPKVVAATATALPPVAAAATAVEPAPVAAPAAAAPIAKPIAVASVAKPAKKAHAASSPAHKHAVLAKHDSKPSRQSKSDLDRLLGL